MTEYTFMARLAILLGADILVAFGTSYIPHDLSPIRLLMAIVQLTLMLITMAVVLRNFIEEF